MTVDFKVKFLRKLLAKYMYTHNTTATYTILEEYLQVHIKNVTSKILGRALLDINVLLQALLTFILEFNSDESLRLARQMSDVFHAALAENGRTGATELNSITD